MSRRPNKAFTLTELLVVIAIAGILTAIAIPVIGRARGSANSATCLSNIRQLGIALLMYSSSNHGQLPNLQNPYWDKAALSMLPNGNSVPYNPILKCPSDEIDRPAGYESMPRSYSINPVLINYNGQYTGQGAVSSANEGMRLTNIGNPGATALLIECHQRLNIFNNGNWIVAASFTAVHGDSMNVAMCDGSAKRVSAKEAINFSADYIRNR